MVFSDEWNLRHNQFQFAKEISSVFKWNGFMKPIGGLFIGTAPEFEFAIYSACFLLRGVLENDKKDCILSLDGQRINILTYPMKYNGKKYIATAFPREI